MARIPEWLEKATHHVASSPSDDDEYWAVPREDGRWDIYVAGMGGGYPIDPYKTVDDLPDMFTRTDQE